MVAFALGSDVAAVDLAVRGLAFAAGLGCGAGFFAFLAGFAIGPALTEGLAGAAAKDGASARQISIGKQTNLQIDLMRGKDRVDSAGTGKGADQSNGFSADSQCGNTMPLGLKSLGVFPFGRPTQLHT